MGDSGRPKTARMRAIRRNESETERSLGTSDLACRAGCSCTPTSPVHFSVGLDLRNDRPVASILQPYSPMSLAAVRPRPHEARSDTRIALARWGREAGVQKQKVCEIQVYVC